MANYLTKNESFHIFSKSPVLSDMAVSQAVNKSGHTVSVSDVWSDDIPWFTEVADEEEAIKRAGDAKYNDLILWGSNIYKRKGDKTNGASSGTTFENLWEKDNDLTEARAYALGSVTTQTPKNIVTKTVEIKNASDKVVLKYHVGKQIDLLTVKNNANVPSSWAARMFINDKVVDQFVSPTDKVFAGNPSTGYTTLVYTATTDSNKYTFVSEGETDGDFVNNAYAGIIQFNQSRNSNHKFAASIFEYVGGKLDITNTIVDGSDAVPNSNAVYDHVKSHENKNIHITSAERTSWNTHKDDTTKHITSAERTSWNNKISNVKNGNYITISTQGTEKTVSVNTTDLLSLSEENKIATIKAIHEGTDITKYHFPELDYEDRKDYIIYDATGNPTYISFADDIVDGTKLFINSNFRKFTLTLPNLTNGNQMFMHNHYLQFVDSDFSKVTDGYRMFRATGSQMFDGDQSGASSPYGNQLKHFRGSLKSLTNGNQMFEGCVLDVDSVCYIIDSLQNENIATANASMTLGIDAQYKSNTTLLNKLNIAEGATSTSVKNKNGITWSLTLQWNTRKPMWKYLQQHSK